MPQEKSFSMRTHDEYGKPLVHLICVENFVTVPVIGCKNAEYFYELIGRPEKGFSNDNIAIIRKLGFAVEIYYK